MGGEWPVISSILMICLSHAGRPNTIHAVVRLLFLLLSKTIGFGPLCFCKTTFGVWTSGMLWHRGLGNWAWCMYSIVHWDFRNFPQVCQLAPWPHIILHSMVFKSIFSLQEHIKERTVPIRVYVRCMFIKYSTCTGTVILCTVLCYRGCTVKYLHRFMLDTELLFRG